MIEDTYQLSFQDITGDASSGGWQVNSNMISDQEEVEFGRHVELYTLIEGGGLWDSDYRLSFSGSMMPQNLTFSQGASSLSVVLATSDMFLNNAGLQGIYFSEQATPANPHQITDLNLGKIVEHIVEQHTNIADSTPGGWVDTARIDTLTSTSVDVYSVRSSNSIWQTIADIAENEFYVRYFTKEDKLVYESHPQFKATLSDVTLTITAQDMLTLPEVIYRNDVVVDQALLYALTDTGTILEAKFPSTVGTEGRRQKYPNLRCNSQTRLNLLAERAYRFLNRELNFRVVLPGAIGAFLELYDRVAVTYSGTTTNGVTINWADKKFWIDRISVRRSQRTSAVTELMLEEENI